jgi:L-2,4-diaminobutyric acid acetyltransferase
MPDKYKRLSSCTVFEQMQEVPIFTFEVPKKRDGREVYDFIRSNPPLDLNSRYAYFLLCDHFSDTSIICRNIGNKEEIVGFIGGYRKPEEPETLFVWQIAVSSECRGHKLSHMMLERLIKADQPVPVKKVEATYTPSNMASYNFFTRFGENKGAEVNTSDYLSEEDLGGDISNHEAEKKIILSFAKQ